VGVVKATHQGMGGCQFAECSTKSNLLSG